MGSSTSRELSPGEVEKIIKNGGIKRLLDLRKAANELGYETGLEELKGLVDQTGNYFTNGYNIGDKTEQRMDVENTPVQSRNWQGYVGKRIFGGSSPVVRSSAIGIAFGGARYKGRSTAVGRIRD